MSGLGCVLKQVLTGLGRVGSRGEEKGGLVCSLRSAVEAQYCSPQVSGHSCG